MNILITGGVGFIGTNCAIYFSNKNKNNRITIIDNFCRQAGEKNAQYLTKKYPMIRIIKSNVADVNNYLPALKKADVIIHLAGQTAVTCSITDPLLDFQSNLIGSFYLLEAVRKYNHKVILLYSSTNKVYGDLTNYSKQKLGVDEKEKLSFISPYGCSKGAVDQYMIDYYRIFGLKTVVFRQSCIYGPFQIGVEDQGWVAHFSKQFSLKKPITIFGDGKQIRDLLYIDDLIDAYNLAINNINKVKGEFFNIGGGNKNAYSLLQVINLISKYFSGYQPKIYYAKSRIGDQRFFISSNNKIKKLLGWQPRKNFEKGLYFLINWQQKNLIR